MRCEERKRRGGGEKCKEMEGGWDVRRKGARGGKGDARDKELLFFLSFHFYSSVRLRVLLTEITKLLTGDVDKRLPLNVT